MLELTQAICDKVIGQITGYKNPFTPEEFIKRFAFDVRLPSQVLDSTTGEETWAQSVNPMKFITMRNAWKLNEETDGILPTRKLEDLDDVLDAWQAVNYTATERQLESENVYESDNIYNSENVVRSMDVHYSKNVAYSDCIRHCEYVVAAQRSHALTYAARVEDSSDCSQSFAISWSGKVSNSMFVHDCSDMFETLFCSHIRSKRFCIANMQFEEAEYFRIKKLVVEWILAPDEARLSGVRRMPTNPHRPGAKRP